MADEGAALVDLRFTLPMLARQVDLDSETVATACALAELEASCIVDAAVALASKGVPFDWSSDPEHAKRCAELIKAAVASAAQEVRALVRA